MGQLPVTAATRASLLVRLRQPTDADAWREFAEVYAPPVFRYCRQLGLQEADASDVVQEVLAQVAVSVRTFEYDPASGRFRDWLGAVVRSKLDRFWRKRSPALGTTDPPAPDNDPSWVVEFNTHLLRVALERIRSGFDEHNWRAFELSWDEDRSALDVALTLGVPTAQVYVAKSRVLKRLREELLLLCEDVPHLARLG